MIDTASPDFEKLAQCSTEELARASMAVYAELVHGVIPARHHEVWIEPLERIVNQPDKPQKLLIIAPPGHAKTKYISEVFPAWYLGRNPQNAILHFTATDPLAGLSHQVVRDTLESEAWRKVFPTPGHLPATPWNFEMGLKLKAAREKVSYRMAGFGAASIGLRSDLCILDDPLDQKRAQSETEQESAKQYFDQTIFTRRKPSASFVVILTRWHWHDLAQHLVERWGFEVIHMPALGYWDGQGMAGGALWPEYWSRDALLENLGGSGEHEGMGLGQFSIVYQGLPTPPEGNMLDPELVQPMPDVRATDENGTLLYPMESVVQYWDLAFKKKTRSDFSACATLGLCRGKVYLLDMFRARLSEGEWELKLHALHAQHTPQIIGIESVSASGWVIEGLEDRTMLPIRAVEVGIASKEARATLFALKLQQRNFYANRKAPYWQVLSQEMLMFPQGAHDDMVDAIAGACHLLSSGVHKVVASTRFLRKQATTVIRPSRWLEARKAKKAKLFSEKVRNMERAREVLSA